MLLLHYDLTFVEHGPLPPHERTWRHPSELAAHDHAVARAETTSAATRLFALTSGTLGLIAVGLLVLAITPERSAAPVAISATTTPAVVGVGQAAGAPASTVVGLRNRPEAMATPIGEGRLAVVTAAGLGAAPGGLRVGEAVQVAVPSGRMHAARVVGRAGDTVVVELERTEPGMQVADEHPGSHEIVTVMARPPVTIVLDQLATLDVEEGTAVLDDDGDLVGLCSEGGDDETRLLVISDELLDRVPDAAPETTVSGQPVVATTGG